MHNRMATTEKKFVISRIGEEVGEFKTSCNFSGDITWLIHFRKQFGVSYKVKTNSNSAPRYSSKRNENMFTKRHVNK